MDGKYVYKIIFRQNKFPFTRIIKFTSSNTCGEVIDRLRGYKEEGYHLEDIKFVMGDGFTARELNESHRPKKFIKKCIHFIKDLFMEKGQWSLARLAFAILFMFVIRTLLTAGGDIPAGVLQLAGLLLGYIFLGKTPWNSLVDSNNDGESGTAITESDAPVMKGTP